MIAFTFPRPAVGVNSVEHSRALRTGDLKLVEKRNKNKTEIATALKQVRCLPHFLHFKHGKQHSLFMASLPVSLANVFYKWPLIVNWLDILQKEEGIPAGP